LLALLPRHLYLNSRIYADVTNTTAANYYIHCISQSFRTAVTSSGFILGVMASSRHLLFIRKL